MFTAALIGATLLGALPVHVEAGACPSATEIERRLGAMLRTASPGAPDVARIIRSSEGLHIELVGPDGAVIAERGLAYMGTCTELADMVAVIVASWESDVHPAFARPAADLVSPTIPAKVESSTTAHHHFDLSAGVGASWADSLAFGGAAALAWFPKGDALGLRLSGLGETTHTADVGIRQAHWNRWLVGLELDWRLAGGTTSLDFHGGAALAILRAGGVNFDQNDSDTSVSAAALVGTRWSLWVTRHLSAWADVTAAYCQRDQALRGTEAQKLPHLQGLLTLGVAVGESSGPR